VPNLTESNRLEVINNVLGKINFMNDKLKSTLKKYNEIEIKLQSCIDTTRVEKAKLDQEIKIKEKQIEKNTSEITKLKKDVEQVI